MKKTILILIIVAIIGLSAFVAFQFFFKNNATENNPVETQRTATTENTNISNNFMENTVPEPVVNSPVETEIAKFSTKILVDDDNRDNNLELTASKVNNQIIKDGETFSFNKIVGNPTPDEGYEKAGIIVNGKKEKGYGGGNCQISSTIYDAALKVKGLKITERHEHGKDVGYVPKGKDATVVYDELDLKFKNETGYDIKLYVDVTESKVNVKIVKLET